MTLLKKVAGSLLLLLFVLACRSQEPQVPEFLNQISFEKPFFSPLEVAANSKTGYIYVVSGSDHVAVFKKDQLITTLSVGDQSRTGLAVDEEQNWVYVLNDSGNSVSVIRDTEVITTLEIDADPSDVEIDPNTHSAYVVSTKKEETANGKVREIKLTLIKEAEVIETISLGQGVSKSVTVDPINSYVYVGTAGGDVIVIKEMQEIARYNMGITVKSMDVDPRTGEVYALYRGKNNQNLTRFKDGQLIDTATHVEGEGGSVQTVQVHPTTGSLYIIDYLRQEVVIVRDMSVIGRVLVGWRPRKMAIDPVTGNVYVTNIGDDTVTVINGTDVLDTISVGWYPYGIGVNPANGWLYVSNTNESSVTILGFEESEYKTYLPLLVSAKSSSFLPLRFLKWYKQVIK